MLRFVCPCQPVGVTASLFRFVTVCQCLPSLRTPPSVPCRVQVTFGFVPSVTVRVLGALRPAQPFCVCTGASLGLGGRCVSVLLP